jgi:hypothetical protein
VLAPTTQPLSMTLVGSLFAAAVNKVS